MQLLILNQYLNVYYYLYYYFEWNVFFYYNDTLVLKNDTLFVGILFCIESKKRYVKYLSFLTNFVSSQYV